jgi:hypothetical protein
MRLSLAILYTPATGKPVRIASIANPELLARAVATAIDEAEFRAERLADFDDELSQIERSEADRLRQILCGLLGPSRDPASPAM